MGSLATLGTLKVANVDMAALFSGPKDWSTLVRDMALDDTATRVEPRLREESARICRAAIFECPTQSL